MALIPQIFFHINKVSLLRGLLWQKRFWPLIFSSDAVPFQSKEVGRFFGPWTTMQENGSSLLCGIISGFHSRVKQTQTETVFFTGCLIRALFLDVTTKVTQKMAELCTEYPLFHGQIKP